MWKAFEILADLTWFRSVHRRNICIKYMYQIQSPLKFFLIFKKNHVCEDLIKKGIVQDDRFFELTGGFVGDYAGISAKVFFFFFFFFFNGRFTKQMSTEC